MIQSPAILVPTQKRRAADTVTRPASTAHAGTLRTAGSSLVASVTGGYGRKSVTPLARRLAVARGDEPADLVVRGGRVLSVFTREWLETDVAVADGWIAGLGQYEGRETLDASGRYVVPGFVDAHLHLESSKLLVDEFARLVLPLGTT